MVLPGRNPIVLAKALAVSVGHSGLLVLAPGRFAAVEPLDDFV